jgi:uncharacterized protein YndB with AHSA1/START domain
MAVKGKVPDKLRRQMVLPVPRKLVWQALTDPEQLAAWFCHRAELALAPGGAVLFDFGGGEQASAEIEKVEAGRRLSFRWHPAGVGQGATLVQFALEDVPRGTRLTLTESGFSALADEVRQRAWLDNEWGWDDELGALRDYLRLPAPI